MAEKLLAGDDFKRSPMALVAATTQPVGTTAVICTTAASTGACALNAGNLITFAGDSQVYTLTANAVQASANAAVTLNISPGLAVAKTGGQTVTVSSIYGSATSGIVNLAFHPWAMAFASRPLINDELGKPAEEEYVDTDKLTDVDSRVGERGERVRHIRAIVDETPHEPNLRGTYIPVHMVAALGRGQTTTEIIHDYATLSAGEVELAVGYA